jgi:hypothetical protein
MTASVIHVVISLKLWEWSDKPTRRGGRVLRAARVLGLQAPGEGLEDPPAAQPRLPPMILSFAFIRSVFAPAADDFIMFSSAHFYVSF